MPENTYDDQVLKHFRKFIATEPNIVKPQDLPSAFLGWLSIAEFSATDERQTWTYATIGAGRYSMPNAPGGNAKLERRIEIVMYAAERRDELVTVLTNLALYPFIKNTFIVAGDRIPGEISITSDSPLTDILFIPPIHEPKEFRVAHVQTLHVDILWAVPLHNSETLFIREHGWRKLVEMFYDKGVDTLDFHRHPIV